MLIDDLKTKYIANFILFMPHFFINAEVDLFFFLNTVESYSSIANNR